MSTIRIGLPKGRMQTGVFALLNDAGIKVKSSDRGYRPSLSGFPDADVKILKPQNVVTMLHSGTRDVGFAGADWVAELGADLVEIVDTGLDFVRIVAAAPENMLVDGKLPKRHLVVASEMERLTRAWIEKTGMDAEFVRTYGATEVFPPEDADCIVDITQTGSTLRANGLAIVDDLMTSSTRLYASRKAMDDPAKREWIEAFALVVRSVIDARTRVMLELNVSSDDLEGLIEVLPCMKTPTVSQLHGSSGFAVKAAVPRNQLATLIPTLRSRGGTDIVVSPISQIVA